MHVTVIGKYGVVAAVGGMFVGPLPTADDDSVLFANADARILERIALQVGMTSNSEFAGRTSASREPTPIRRRHLRRAA